MDLFDVIIVGSGPSAVSALASLKNKKVLVLDVGMVSDVSSKSLTNPMTKLKRDGAVIFTDVIGEKLESLNNINREYISPKIKAPLMKFISSQYDLFNKFKTNNFFVLGSYAKGGLSNAWGGGSMRYTDEDLKDFPIKYSDLEKYYDILTENIGISGMNDDLSEEFIKDDNLLPAPILNFLSQELLKKYNQKKRYFHRKNFRIGFPRSAFITSAKSGREIYDYKGLEFFKPYTNSIYNSKFFLEEMVKEYSNISYIDKKMVTALTEEDGLVSVFATDIESSKEVIFKAKKLILAAGCINSSKIVLQSYKEYETKLPMLDNLVTYIPFVNFKFIGKKEIDAFIPPQLLLIAKHKGQKYLCSMYKLNATLCGDYQMDFPLSIKGTFRAVKYLVPSILVMQVFYPDHPKSLNYLSLSEDGILDISYGDEAVRGELEKNIIKSFRKLGFYSMSFLIKKLMPGNSFHYSGTLPMKENPKKFQINRDCKLFGTENVYVVDGSVFPVLQAKNNTFTIMANAMRVGDIISHSV